MLPSPASILILLLFCCSSLSLFGFSWATHDWHGRCESSSQKQAPPEPEQLMVAGPSERAEAKVNECTTVSRRSARLSYTLCSKRSSLRCDLLFCHGPDVVGAALHDDIMAMHCTSGETAAAVTLTVPAEAKLSCRCMRVGGVVALDWSDLHMVMAP